MPELLCKITEVPKQKLTGPNAVIVGIVGVANTFMNVTALFLQPFVFVTV